MVEFALSSVVLLLLVGGLVDIGRSVFISEALSNAAREGARHGAWFNAPTESHPYLDDAQIKATVDPSWPRSRFRQRFSRTPSTTCPRPPTATPFTTRLS